MAAASCRVEGVRRIFLRFFESDRMERGYSEAGQDRVLSDEVLCNGSGGRRSSRMMEIGRLAMLDVTNAALRPGLKIYWIKRQEYSPDPFPSCPERGLAFDNGLRITGEWL